MKSFHYSSEISPRLKSSFSLILIPGVPKNFLKFGRMVYSSKSPRKRTKTVLIGFKLVIFCSFWLINNPNAWLEVMRNPGYKH